jgi:ribosomal protein S18 acetylase RimI-like enzyme
MKTVYGDGPISVRPLEASDHRAWARLFAAYRYEEGLSPNDEIVARVWSWLLDPDINLHGCAAFVDGNVAGLAHFHLFPRPLSGSHGIYLDNLFVDGAYRRRRVASTLLVYFAEIARSRGCTLLRWVVRPDNLQACELYERIAERAEWQVFEAGAPATTEWLARLSNTGRA